MKNEEPGPGEGGDGFPKGELSSFLVKKERCSAKPAFLPLNLPGRQPNSGSVPAAQDCAARSRSGAPVLLLKINTQPRYTGT